MLHISRDLINRVHLRGQALRFGRVFVFAAALQLAALGGQHFTRDALISAGVAALETAYRQVFPVAPLKQMTQSLASTPAAAEPPAVQ